MPILFRNSNNVSLFLKVPIRKGSWPCVVKCLNKKNCTCFYPFKVFIELSWNFLSPLLIRLLSGKGVLFYWNWNHPHPCHVFRYQSFFCYIWADLESVKKILSKKKKKRNKGGENYTFRFFRDMWFNRFLKEVKISTSVCLSSRISIHHWKKNCSVLFVAPHVSLVVLECYVFCNIAWGNFSLPEPGEDLNAHAKILFRWLLLQVWIRERKKKKISFFRAHFSSMNY